jgi:hypothetical protein
MGKKENDGRGEALTTDHTDGKGRERGVINRGKLGMGEEGHQSSSVQIPGKNPPTLNPLPDR